MAGDANPIKVDGYSSPEEALSPIMSDEALNMLENENNVFMTNYTPVPWSLPFETNSNPLGSQDPLWPQISQQSTESGYALQELGSATASNEMTSDQINYTQLNHQQDQASGSEFVQNDYYDRSEQNNYDGNQLYRDFRGQYDFDIVHQEQDQHVSKSVPWTYSPILNKLFVSFNLACPIQFTMSSEPPIGCFIRAMPYFTQPEHADRPVPRCLNHQNPDDLSNRDFPHVQHVIRCNAAGALYECSVDGRYSVVVPYITECNSVTMAKYFSYFFACYSSCMGGMNRRPIVVVFSLEHGNQILGRKVLEVRICACPGRDRAKSERNYLRKRETEIRATTNMTECEPPAPREENEVQQRRPPETESRPPPEKQPRTSDDDSDNTILVGVQFRVFRHESHLAQTVLNGIRDSFAQSHIQPPPTPQPNLNNQLLNGERKIKREPSFQ